MAIPRETILEKSNEFKAVELEIAGITVVLNAAAVVIVIRQSMLVKSTRVRR